MRVCSLNQFVAWVRFSGQLRKKSASARSIAIDALRGVDEKITHKCRLSLYFEARFLNLA
jgi:hypothetical protein